MSTGSVTIRWLSSAERASAAAIWTTLERTVVPGGVACSWAWTDTWLAHYGEVVPHRFAVAHVEGAPVGVALVTRGVGQKRGPFRVRTVHLGTAGEPPGSTVFVEYNRILVKPDARAGFAAALLRELGDEPGWDELVLDGFTPEDAEAFLQHEGRFRAHPAMCPSTDLRSAHETDGDVLRTLRPTTRRKVRRGLRGLGAIATEWADTAQQGLDILEELIWLHQRWWRRSGQPGAFASERFVAFHRELVARLTGDHAVLMFRVRAGGKTVACLYHLIEEGRVLFYQSGLASYPDAEIRPGFVAFALCMQECFERGLHEYNFLAGDARYKRELSTGQQQLVWATWRRSTLRGRLIDSAAKAKAWTATTRRRSGRRSGDALDAPRRVQAQRPGDLSIDVRSQPQLELQQRP